LNAKRHYETIVLGGGTMGTAAAWELGKRGERALVLEQFEHVHDRGSHSGQTRIIRHAYAEGPDYIPLVLRADELWMELEESSGVKVFHRVGGLELAAPGFDHARLAKEAAAQHDVPLEWIDAAEVRRRWPVFILPDDWEAGYGARSGFLDVEPALQAMGDQARINGVKIHENEAVQSWEIDGEGVRITTADETYTADRLIITAGAWAAKMLGELGLPLEVRRKVLFWLEVEDESLFQPERMPVYISDSSLGEIYGFPVYDQPGLKIARHDGGTLADPDHLDRDVQSGEEADVVALAQQLFPGVTGKVVSSAVCMYTMTPDANFIVDRHPEHPNVVIGAGFSGHGFKFATAIGEYLVDLATDDMVQPLPILAIDRFAVGRI
jgi:N-methyl-L-tryptophan oxidase